MARYIDADLIPYTDDDDYLSQYAYRYDINEVPTADVVPKSEYDNLKMQFEALDRECDRLEKAESEKHDKFIESKADVAREIFAEIYKSVASKIPMEIRPIFKDDMDFDAGFINGKRDSLLDVLVLIAELKKKYTEGESNGCKQ